MKATQKLKAKPRRQLKSRGAKGQKPIVGNALPATLVPRVNVGRLRTVADWHRQVGKVFREMRNGLTPPEIGTRLTYVARVGADLAKFTQELEELKALRTQLAALQGQQLPALGFAQVDQEGGSEALSGDLVGPEGQEQTT